MRKPAVSMPRLPTARWSVAVFVLSAVAMALTAVASVKFGPTILQHPFAFFDLKIYRGSAGVLLSGHALYAARFQMGFGFTYPPFAALMFAGLQVLPLVADECLVSLINVALVVMIARVAIAMSEPPTAVGSSSSQWRKTWLVAALGLWTEPIVTAIGYGQIDLLVAALVWGDLVWLRNSRWGGSGIGLAAGLKLTPLVFIPYLALTGRWRTALRSGQTFLASIIVSFAVAPRDAWAYWGRAVFDTGRVTGHRPFAGRGPADQSLRGLLLRLAGGTPHLSEVWLVACVVVAAGGLWLAVEAHRRGDDAFGCVLMAIVGLLVCPVSWTHHWVIAMPGLVLLARSGRGGTRALAAVTALTLAAVSSSIWVVIATKTNGAHLDPAQFLIGDLYVIVGIAVIGAAAAHELRHWWRWPYRWRSPGHPRGQLRNATTRAFEPGPRRS